jgi:hypothetical protein
MDPFRLILRSMSLEGWGGPRFETRYALLAMRPIEV